MGRAEAREKLRNCDVFVNLSLRDNADAWLIESMAAGLPVISLSFGGQGFLIQDDWGIKVKLDNREKTALSIAEALERLLIHSKLRRRMARAAIKNAANCTWHRLGKKLQGIYGEAFLQEEDVRFSRKGKDRFFY
jgi:glycosyltransferase involved in cell wall biosynthesis